MVDPIRAGADSSSAVGGAFQLQRARQASQTAGPPPQPPEATPTNAQGGDRAPAIPTSDGTERTEIRVEERRARDSARRADREAQQAGRAANRETTRERTDIDRNRPVETSQPPPDRGGNPRSTSAGEVLDVFA